MCLPDIHTLVLGGCPDPRLLLPAPPCPAPHGRLAPLMPCLTLPHPVLPRPVPSPPCPFPTLPLPEQPVLLSSADYTNTGKKVPGVLPTLRGKPEVVGKQALPEWMMHKEVCRQAG